LGYEYLEVDTRYSYVSAVDLRGVLSTLEETPTRASAIQLAPEGDSHSVYVSDRWRITDRFVADLGLRWDRQTYLPPGDDEQFSPRSSFLYRLSSQTDLRFSYGRFFQTEGALDLQVEDGVVGFAPAQNASHSIVGVQHRFPGNLALRGELFRKWTSSARPRYENLYDPLVILPELRPGRVRVAPDRADSRGFEVLLSQDDGAVSWWFSYAYTKVVDVIAGDRVPRGWDQRHALNGGATWSAGPWSLSSVATIHSGWPTTTLALEPSNASNAVDGVVAVPGPRNAENLDVNRRIDFRASRSFDAGPGSVRFFAELTNVTNRENPCCVRYESITVAGQPALERVERNGLPFIVNVGALWQF
jgi:outer membrane receptor protein involved in Fe transport